MKQILAMRQSDLARVTHPLPGSVPYENHLTLSVKQTHDGWSLFELLVDRFPQIGADTWQQRLSEGRFLAPNGEIASGNRIVRAGDRYLQSLPPVAEPDVNPDIRFLHEDQAICIIRKPAPLPMHPCGRFNRNTLQSILNQIVQPPLRPVHRLDANTSGLVLFARTKEACTQLHRQFQQRTVGKHYLARVAGHPGWQHCDCHAAISPTPDKAGSRVIDENHGQPAHTEFQVLQRFSDGTTLLRASLFTGRTNQIRLHLHHLGHPVCGDATYLPLGQYANIQTLNPDQAPLKLHAWRLEFIHPLTAERFSFEDETPLWASDASEPALLHDSTSPPPPFFSTPPHPACIVPHT